MENYRDAAARDIKAIPKTKRGDALHALQQTNDYWDARAAKLLSGQKAEFNEDRTELYWKVKSVYHGTDVQDIEEFNFADESTIGDKAVYFAADPKLGIGYARHKRNQNAQDTAHVYEAVLTDVRMQNWAENASVDTLKREFAAYCGVIMKEMRTDGYEAVVKKYDLPEFLATREHMAHMALTKILDTIEDESLHRGNLKAIAQGAMGIFFERFVASKGCDGVITFEGGEGDEHTKGGGLSVVVFNREKISNHRRFSMEK